MTGTRERPVTSCGTSRANSVGPDDHARNPSASARARCAGSCSIVSWPMTHTLQPELSSLRWSASKQTTWPSRAARPTAPGPTRKMTPSGDTPNVTGRIIGSAPSDSETRPSCTVRNKPSHACGSSTVMPCWSTSMTAVSRKRARATRAQWPVFGMFPRLGNRMTCPNTSPTSRPSAPTPASTSIVAR